MLSNDFSVRPHIEDVLIRLEHLNVENQHNVIVNIRNLCYYIFLSNYIFQKKFQIFHKAFNSQTIINYSSFLKR